MSAIQETSELLAKLRAEIVQLGEERAKIKEDSVPRDEALEAIARAIEHNASWVTPNYGVLVRPGANPAELDLVPNGRVASALCSFFPDLVRNRLVEEVDRHLEERPPGIPTAERPAALAEIDAAIRKLGVEEEEIIVAAEAAGIELDRREDADPAIVLGFTELEGHTPPPKPREKPKGKQSQRSWTEVDLKTGRAKPKQNTRPTRV